MARKEAFVLVAIKLSRFRLCAKMPKATHITKAPTAAQIHGIPFITLKLRAADLELNFIVGLSHQSEGQDRDQKTALDGRYPARVKSKETNQRADQGQGDRADHRPERRDNAADEFAPANDYRRDSQEGVRRCGVD